MQEKQTATHIYVLQLAKTHSVHVWPKMYIPLKNLFKSSVSLYVGFSFAFPFLSVFGFSILLHKGITYDNKTEPHFPLYTVSVG